MKGWSLLAILTGVQLPVLGWQRKINFMFSEARIQKIWRGATCDKIYVILKIFWNWSMTITRVINKTPASPGSDLATSAFISPTFCVHFQEMRKVAAFDRHLKIWVTVPRLPTLLGGLLASRRYLGKLLYKE